MMLIDDNGYIEYNMKEVQETYVPTRVELIMNNKKKKHGRN